jgi:hypothetical protein
VALPPEIREEVNRVAIAELVEEMTERLRAHGVPDRFRAAGVHDPAALLRAAARAVVGARVGHPASVRALHASASRSPALAEVFGLLHGWLSASPRMHALAASAERHQTGRRGGGGGHGGGHHGGAHGGHHGGGGGAAFVPAWGAVDVVEVQPPQVVYVQDEPPDLGPIVVVQQPPSDEVQDFGEAVTDITTGYEAAARGFVPVVSVPRSPRVLGDPLGVSFRAPWIGPENLGAEYLAAERQRMNRVPVFADEEPEPWRRPWARRRTS